jgi:hypothetical protein
MQSYLSIVVYPNHRDFPPHNREFSPKPPSRNVVPRTPTRGLLSPSPCWGGGGGGESPHATPSFGEVYNILGLQSSWGINTVEKKYL